MTELKKVSKKSKNLTKKTILGGQTKWKKVKLAGNLLSDEGGAGLEGLLGLEVLENYDCKITKQKIPKVSEIICKKIHEYIGNVYFNRTERFQDVKWLKKIRMQKSFLIMKIQKAHERKRKRRRRSQKMHQKNQRQENLCY